MPVSFICIQNTRMSPIAHTHTYYHYRESCRLWRAHGPLHNCCCVRHVRRTCYTHHSIFCRTEQIHILHAGRRPPPQPPPGWISWALSTALTSNISLTAHQTMERVTCLRCGSASGSGLSATVGAPFPHGSHISTHLSSGDCVACARMRAENFAHVAHLRAWHMCMPPVCTMGNGHRANTIHRSAPATHMAGDEFVWGHTKKKRTHTPHTHRDPTQRNNANDVRCIINISIGIPGKNRNSE